MRAAYIIVGVIVLLLLFGFIYALLYQNRGTTATGYLAPGQTAYTANTYQTVSGCPTGGCPSQPVYQTSGCPSGCPAQAYAPEQVVYSAPVVYPMYTTAATCPTTAYNSAATWYTSPAAYTYSTPGAYSYQYYNPGSYSQTVIPGSYYQVAPGYQQTYQYNIPGYSSGGYYQYPQPVSPYQYPAYQPGYQYVQTSASAGTSANGGWYY